MPDVITNIAFGVWRNNCDEDSGPGTICDAPTTPRDSFEVCILAELERRKELGLRLVIPRKTLELLE